MQPLLTSKNLYNLKVSQQYYDPKKTVLSVIGYKPSQFILLSNKTIGSQNNSQTTIQLYSEKTKISHHLLTINADENVVSATTNSSHSLLIYTICDQRIKKKSHSQQEQQASNKNKKEKKKAKTLHFNQNFLFDRKNYYLQYRSFLVLLKSGNKKKEIFKTKYDKHFYQFFPNKSKNKKKNEKVILVHEHNSIIQQQIKFPTFFQKKSKTEQFPLLKNQTKLVEDFFWYRISPKCENIFVLSVNEQKVKVARNSSPNTSTNTNTSTNIKTKDSTILNANKNTKYNHNNTNITKNKTKKTKSIEYKLVWYLYKKNKYQKYKEYPLKIPNNSQDLENSGWVFAGDKINNKEENEKKINKKKQNNQILFRYSSKKNDYEIVHLRSGINFLCHQQKLGLKTNNPFIRITFWNLEYLEKFEYNVTLVGYSQKFIKNCRVFFGSVRRMLLILIPNCHISLIDSSKEHGTCDSLSFTVSEFANFIPISNENEKQIGKQNKYQIGKQNKYQNNQQIDQKKTKQNDQIQSLNIIPFNANGRYTDYLNLETMQINRFNINNNFFLFLLKNKIRYVKKNDLIVITHLIIVHLKQPELLIKLIKYIVVKYPEYLNSSFFKEYILSKVYQSLITNSNFQRSLLSVFSSTSLICYGSLESKNNFMNIINYSNLFYNGNNDSELKKKSNTISNNIIKKNNHIPPSWEPFNLLNLIRKHKFDLHSNQPHRERKLFQRKSLILKKKQIRSKKYSLLPLNKNNSSGSISRNKKGNNNNDDNSNNNNNNNGISNNNNNKNNNKKHLDINKIMKNKETKSKNKSNYYDQLFQKYEYENSLLFKETKTKAKDIVDNSSLLSKNMIESKNNSNSLKEYQLSKTFSIKSPHSKKIILEDNEIDKEKGNNKNKNKNKKNRNNLNYKALIKPHSKTELKSRYTNNKKALKDNLNLIISQQINYEKNIDNLEICGLLDLQSILKIYENNFTKYLLTQNYFQNSNTDSITIQAKKYFLEQTKQIQIIFQLLITFFYKKLKSKYRILKESKIDDRILKTNTQNNTDNIFSFNIKNQNPNLELDSNPSSDLDYNLERSHRIGGGVNVINNTPTKEQLSPLSNLNTPNTIISSLSSSSSSSTSPSSSSSSLSSLSSQLSSFSSTTPTTTTELDQYLNFSHDLESFEFINLEDGCENGKEKGNGNVNVNVNVNVNGNTNKKNCYPSNLMSKKQNEENGKWKIRKRTTKRRKKMKDKIEIKKYFKNNTLKKKTVYYQYNKKMIHRKTEFVQKITKKRYLLFPIMKIWEDEQENEHSILKMNLQKKNTEQLTIYEKFERELTKINSNKIHNLKYFKKLFNVFENFYFTLEELNLPFPIGFHKIFLRLAFYVLPPKVFLQYVDLKILVIDYHFSLELSLLYSGNLKKTDFYNHLITLTDLRYQALKLLQKNYSSKKLLVEYYSSLVAKNFLVKDPNSEFSNIEDNGFVYFRPLTICFDKLQMEPQSKNQQKIEFLQENMILYVPEINLSEIKNN
ncbi:gamma-secretase-activating protein [Anaeramoeba flamelloides]|uniref:Gamma-secretase-activating protein n=1 Tax=Anaeramoeba flamelloides TaxID=1746091 RepID=A0ABQ8YJN3_9EUKA|nr:gamma-secretase-activating protein [Anaeramoeba flamelloides]